MSCQYALEQKLNIKVDRCWLFKGGQKYYYFVASLDGIVSGQRNSGN